MNFKYFLNVGFVAILLSSCTAKVPVETQNSANFKEIVKNPETTLVDVRIPEEFNTETAKGAINIPLAKIEDNIDFFKKQKKVVLFCNRGIQAEKALEILNKNGVKNVYFGKTLDNVKAIQNEKQEK